MQDIEANISKFIKSIELAQNVIELEKIKVTIFGKKGFVTNLINSLKDMPLNDKKSLGIQVNNAKKQLKQALFTKQKIFADSDIAKKLASSTYDLTLPLLPNSVLTGRIHPISYAMKEIVTIFEEFGFTEMDGPDIETDDYNFSKLNFPENHPARQMIDTFFLPKNHNGEKMLLRTHTSPVQIRTMLKYKPPLKIICPGRVYRQDFDQTHTPMFHQVECLMIDKKVNFANLKWLVTNFLKKFFEIDELKMRFRPSFFPFTEPSAEVDISWTKDTKNSSSSGGAWMEIMGCGVVHPKVLSNCGIDPDIYQGIAWGLGVDRVTMLKYGIKDLRALFEGDVRWLNHYGFPIYQTSGFNS